MPAYNLQDAKILEGFNHNLFNRFFTKDEVRRIVGIVGSDADSTDDIHQIIEPTAYRQDNQLQPVVSTKVGNIDWFLSFQDFINRLQLLGVDTDRFDEWGSSLQFNWVPPIDFDKLINYQDYFWNSDAINDPPQYITIKNQTTWVEGRTTGILRSIGTSMPSYDIVSFDEPGNIVEVLGDQTSTIRDGTLIVLTASSALPVAATVLSTLFNVVAGTTDVALDSSEYDIVIGVNDNYTVMSNTEVEFTGIDEDARRIFVDGDLTDLFTHGYVFSTENSISGKPIKLWMVESSEIGQEFNTFTIITVTEDFTFSDFDWTRITTKPLIRLTEAEYNAIASNPYALPNLTLPSGTQASEEEAVDDEMGNIIWVQRTLLYSGTTGVAEGTTLGSKLFTDTSGAKNFLDGTYQVGDIVRISGTGFDGDHPIENIVTSDILGLDMEFFTQTAIDYTIVRERLLTDIESATNPPITGVDQLWFDTTNDQLKSWNGVAWEVRLDNYSYLVNITNNGHLVTVSQDNDWVDQNKWTHIKETVDFSDKSRARLPIIEYFPYVTLSQQSFADKQWKYRKTAAITYETTTVEPTLFEIIDTRKTVGGNEISFQNNVTVVFDEKFGNLTEELSEYTPIRLGDFGANTGEYTIVSSEFVQLAPTQRYITRAIINPAVSNTGTPPTGAFIAPVTTSMGDPWLTAETYQWQFDGFEDIYASSIESTPNPMLQGAISTGITGSLSTILGLAYQEFKYIAGSPSVGGATFTLDSSLHDLCLYEEYQEGDLRVYINGVRQYGNFTDLVSPSNPMYVGSIIFNASVIITDNDIVRIEAGEYALRDIGKRAVTVNTDIGPEPFNLVDSRRIEQQKSDRSQYPWFNVYDIHENAFKFASNVFKYTYDAGGVYSPELDQRIYYDEVSQNYEFEQDLLDGDTGELYVYYDAREYDNEFQTIWKHGTYNEQYIPSEEDGLWEIPNQLYYNVSHENRKVVKLGDIFRHFSSIINAQVPPGISDVGYYNLYHVDGVVNYGLGGRIKEHNDGFDTLISALFVNNSNPVDIINFASNQYDSLQKTVGEILETNLTDYLNLEANGTTILAADVADVEALTNYITSNVKTLFEINDRLDQWFGDSTTFDASTSLGVKNWIATIPFLGLAPSKRPYILDDRENDFLQLVHHDTHRKNISINQAALSGIYNAILRTTTSVSQTITSESDPFPTTIDGLPLSTGDLVLRINTITKTRVLYRYSALAVWEELDITLLLAEVLLGFEEDLFDMLGTYTWPDNFVSKYNFNITRSNVAYPQNIKTQFSQYVKTNNLVAPFINTGYIQNDPFSWNYAFTTIHTDPSTGGTNSNVFASWEALYESIYGTPYPHMEPWTLQGYDFKPLWWDLIYSDPTRRWLTVMWTNILSGIVPFGVDAPNGDPGTGLANQITNLFSYIPVNMDGTNTSDGYVPDDILPPYWNSNNTANPAVRGLYDASLNEFIITPHANYDFDQLGPDEWGWTISSRRLYDELVVAFKLQPLKFLNQTFGLDLVDVACLQVTDIVNKVRSHLDIEFHGDMLDDNTVFQVNGFNQWYVHFNRYNGFDGVSSEFRSMWKNWIAPLTYQFAAFIDTQNFKLSSDLFDATKNDYDIVFKKTTGIRNVWIDALTAAVVSMPSRFASETANGLGWTISLNNTSPIGRPIERFGVQNFPVRVIAGDPTIKTFSFLLDEAITTDSFGFDLVNYAEILDNDLATELIGATTYTASVLFNSVTVVNLSVLGSDAPTFGDLINVLNTQLGTTGTASISNGNLMISSDTIGGTTNAVITEIDLFTTASSNYLGTTGNQFNPVSFSKIFYVGDDVVEYFPETSSFNIVDSTNFNGLYTVSAVTYNISEQRTRIEVREDVFITNVLSDGYLEPVGAVTLPDEWVTGRGLSWSTNGVTPPQYNTVDLYYMIRDNDREFRLATTREDAFNDINNIVPGNSGTNQQYVGRIKNTFTAFAARSVSQYWKQHYVDERVVYVDPTPITISGVQNMIDFINGYSAYLDSLGVVYIDTDGKNRDVDSGRENNWQTTTEQLIEFLYRSRGVVQELREKHKVIPDYTTYTFTSPDIISWVTGTRVTLDSINGSLPPEFENPIASSIPYFVMRTTTQGTLQLAGSRLDAQNGIPLKFTYTPNVGDIILTISPTRAVLPVINLDPHNFAISIEHETGIVSNVLAGSNLDLLTDQRVYGAGGNNLSSDDIIVSRRDKRTQIELSNARYTLNIANPANAVYMYGMHIFLDGYEHILQFPNYSASGILIYDPFLGINTPRFFLEFDRQETFTLRPNVGGNVVLGQTQIQNIESAAESLRRAYSTYQSKEKDEITFKVREAIGYDGPYDYADDISITDKSQFIFYRGLIQKKGTNFAADAWANQTTYDSLIVDEFWATRLGCFGDSKEKVYPELNLYTTDVIRNELRLEFIAPVSAVPVSTPSVSPSPSPLMVVTPTPTTTPPATPGYTNFFFPVDLTDDSRWYEQPDQVEKLAPRDRFYINARVVERFEDVVASPSYAVINGGYYLELSSPADGAYVNYLIPASSPVKWQELTEGTDYIFVTNKLMEFINPLFLPTTREINVSTLSYSYDAQNPATILNHEAGTVVTPVPIWNPARQEYYARSIYPVTFRQNSDPAKYNNYMATATIPDTNFWHDKRVSDVWFDINSEGYLPYDDTNIQTDLNDRLKNWGVFSDWGEINLYQWTESDVLPSEWDAIALTEERAGILPVNERKTGTTRKVVYRNDGTPTVPVWVEERDVHYDFTNAIVTATSYSNAGLTDGQTLDVYSDGVFVESKLFVNSAAFSAYVTALTVAGGTITHLIAPSTIPTETQLGDLDYKLDTPYSVYNNINPDTGREEFTYYFWVQDKLNDIPVLGGSTDSITLRAAAEGLHVIPSPYMIPNHLVDVTTTSFANLFITNSPRKNDTVSYEFPYTYDQLIIKGLDDNVRADDSYTLRFVRDFTLRDRLTSNDPDISDMQRKNVHWEWELIREKQLAKIDRGLWCAITESLLGFEYDCEPLIVPISPTPTPTVTPTSSVTPTQGSSPTPTPTYTVTPSVTSSPAVTVTPSITPSNTPAPGSSATPTPSPSNSAVPVTGPVTPTPTLTPDGTPAPGITLSPTPTVTPTITTSLTPEVTETPVVTPTPTPLDAPLGGEFYNLRGVGYQRVDISSPISFNSNGTITTPTSVWVRRWASSMPPFWRNRAFNPTDYWFLATITSQNYVAGFRSGPFGVWTQMPASGNITYENHCRYDNRNGAGEAETTFTLQVALSAGGPPVDGCTIWLSSTSVQANPPPTPP